MATPIQVVFDCRDPAGLGSFWAAALGYVEHPVPDGFATWDEFLEAQGVPEHLRDSAYAIVDPDGVGPRIFFQRVPEEKVTKNRVHLDVNVSGGHASPMQERRQTVEAEARRLEGLGGRVVGPVDAPGEFHIAMLDPEGNEFDLQ